MRAGLGRRGGGAGSRSDRAVAWCRGRLSSSAVSASALHFGVGKLLGRRGEFIVFKIIHLNRGRYLAAGRVR